MTRTLEETLAWAGDGAAHLRGHLARLADAAFAAPSALPGWSRAHVLSHIARNADAMINLLTWARTGVETPAYTGRQQRDADIETGAARDPATIRADVVESSDRLADAVRAMPEQAWQAVVRNVAGHEIPATDIPWARAREMWIHTIDLDVGASFRELPMPMLHELLADAATTVAHAEGAPSLRLVGTDPVLELVVGDGEPVEVRGSTAALVGWVLGRDRGRDLRTADGGRRLPTLPRWL